MSQYVTLNWFLLGKKPTSEVFMVWTNNYYTVSQGYFCSKSLELWNIFFGTSEKAKQNSVSKEVWKHRRISPYSVWYVQWKKSLERQSNSIYWERSCICQGILVKCVLVHSLSNILAGEIKYIYLNRSTGTFSF